MTDVTDAMQTTGCHITQSGGNWLLNAVLAEPAGSADFTCGAYCFTLQ